MGINYGLTNTKTIQNSRDMKLEHGFTLMEYEMTEVETPGKFQNSQRELPW